MKTAREVYAVVCVFVAAVIGAGFASGQEVASFFIEVRGNGMWGILLTGIFFAVSALGIMSVVRKEETSLRGFYEKIVGKRLAAFSEALLLAFQAYTFCVMVQGSGAMLYEVRGFTPLLGIALMLIPCFLVLSCDVRGLVSVTSLVTPLMVVGVVVTAFLSHAVPAGMFGEVKSAAGMLSKGWFLKAFLYAGYNMLGSGMVLITLRPYFRSKRSMYLSAIFSGGLLAVLLLTVFFAMLPHWLSLGGLDIPMLYVASLIGTDARIFYAALLYLAMFTTAVSCGFVVVERFGGGSFKRRMTCALGLSVLSLLFTFFGFSGLVGKGFAFFGILSTWILIKTLWRGFRSIFEDFECFLRKKEIISRKRK